MFYLSYSGYNVQLNIHFSQGSAATDLRCGERFRNRFFSAVHLRMWQKKNY